MNIQGELLILKTNNIKPNFSDLQRRYGIDRHTIKKYWTIGRKPSINGNNKGSKLDKYKDEIVKKLQQPGITKKGAFEFFKDKFGNHIFKSYSTFRSYTIRNDIKKQAKITPHVRFETSIGDQLQVDWKESLSMTSANGEVIEFNLFCATLSYSRLHLFLYSSSKTTEDFTRCVVDTLNKLGGTPKHILTDNMSAIVSVYNGRKTKHDIIKQFEKDIGISIKLCKTRSPQTKGKVESSNRFVSWIKAYDGEFKDEADLIKIIDKVNIKINAEPNKTTNIPPIVLFAKEKEYLKPLPNKLLLESYVLNVKTQIVPQTLLITYKGSGYSLPHKFIGKRVKIVPIANKLYIYDNTELIVVHDINNKTFNYIADHYTEALRESIKNKEVDIDKVSKDNLALLEGINL